MAADDANGDYRNLELKGNEFDHALIRGITSRFFAYGNRERMF